MISFEKICEFNMNGLKTQVDLNILPLGSYDLLTWMYCLEKHRVILNCYDKTISCLDEESNTIVVKENPWKITIREISALQMKRSFHKGCKVFANHIIDDREENNQVKLEYIPIQNDFKDVFLEEIPG